MPDDYWLACMPKRCTRQKPQLSRSGLAWTRLQTFVNAVLLGEETMRLDVLLFHIVLGSQWK